MDYIIIYKIKNAAFLIKNFIVLETVNGHRNLFTWFLIIFVKLYLPIQSIRYELEDNAKLETTEFNIFKNIQAL